MVHCYSGHTYAQEPQSFEWQGQHHHVAHVVSVRRVLDESSGTVVTEFAVETEGGQRFRLGYNDVDDTWTIECAEPSVGPLLI